MSRQAVLEQVVLGIVFWLWTWPTASVEASMERRNFAAVEGGDVGGDSALPLLLLLLRMRSVPLRESRCLQHSALNHGAKQTRCSLFLLLQARSILVALSRMHSEKQK